MQNIITIHEKVLLDAAVPTVNARDLHAFLEVGKRFATWITDRIEQYEFVENQDFVIGFPNSGNQSGRGGDRRTKEYHLTIDMAKELSMIERTPKGKEARQYFIACEKAYRQISSDETSSANVSKINVDPLDQRFPSGYTMAKVFRKVDYLIARAGKYGISDKRQALEFAIQRFEQLAGLPIRWLFDGLPICPLAKDALPIQDPVVAIASIQETDIRLAPDATLNVSDLGVLLGGYTGIAFNRLLYGLGYQIRHTIRGKSEWHPTEKGSPFAVKTFVPRAGGRGSDVPQLLWKAKVLEALRAEPAVQKSLNPAKH